MFKALFILILLYLLVRTVRNLVRAVIGPGQAPPQMRDPRTGRAPRGVADRSDTWHGPEPPRRRRLDEDIEDAKWEDLS